MSSDDKKFGDIEFQGKDILVKDSIKYDRIAVSDRSELLMVSIVAADQTIKQVRAILAPGQTKVVATAAGAKIKRPGEKDYYLQQPGRLFLTDEGYFCYKHKLGYGMAHAIFLTKMHGFMKVVTEESLWRELNQTRFTTPILREWMPFIEEQLRLSTHLTNARVLNCACGVLTATTKKIDDIVSEGLQQGLIEIPRSAVAV